MYNSYLQDESGKEKSWTFTKEGFMKEEVRDEHWGFKAKKRKGKTHSVLEVLELRSIALQLTTRGRQLCLIYTPHLHLCFKSLLKEHWEEEVMKDNPKT